MIWWIIGAALFGVAALSIWAAFRNPAFIAGLIAVAVRAALPSIKAAFRTSPEKAKQNQEDARDGTRRTITGREREH